MSQRLKYEGLYKMKEAVERVHVVDLENAKTSSFEAGTQSSARHSKLNRWIWMLPSSQRKRLKKKLTTAASSL